MLYTASNVYHHLNIISETSFICNFLQKNNQYVIYCYLNTFFVCQTYHLTILIKFYVVLYTPTPFWGYFLKSVIADHKVLPYQATPGPTRRYFCCGSFMLFLSCVCYTFVRASVYCCLVVTCWERADLLALVCDV